ncbi:TolA-binding protein [Caballeronia udeis]|uniref:TolA-binding protein n=1 Tax=Caballeronia udeis TaxID=1232866 RepID=A0ABW8MQB2_9BURK
MPGENSQVETGEVVEQPAELSLREELVKNLADLKSDPVDPPIEAPVEKTVTATPTEPKTGDAPVSKTAPTEVTPPVESKAKVPQSWSATEKAHWDKIPAEVQAVIARREEEAHRGITALGQDASLGKQLKEVISPYLPMIRAEGGTEAGAVRDLLQTAYILRTGNPTQKVDVLRHVAGLYGVDLAVAAQTVQQVDPQVHQLQTKIAQLEGRFVSAEQQQHQQVQGQAQSIIETFAADPKNEFYEQVKPVMAQLLVGGIAKDMQEAYDMACHAAPDVRSTILTRQTADAEAKRAAEAKAKADAKRRAAGSISGSPAGTVSTTTTANQDLSLRDELRQAMRAVTS